MSDSNPGGEQIGRSVRRLRKERGLTQADLAEQIGRSRSLIQQIENGTRIPPQEVREHLSSILGEALSVPGGDDPDRGSSELRLQFNILLGKDPVAVARGMAIAQKLIDAGSVPEHFAPFREIVEGQLKHVEQSLAQLPSGEMRVRDWNTVSDWVTLLTRARSSVRAVHKAGLGTITGDVGEEYLKKILELARSGVSVRRYYLVTSIEDVFASDIGLWRQAKAGVDACLVDREHMPNVPAMLVVDDTYKAHGEYDWSGLARTASKFFTQEHEEVRLAIQGFARLDSFRADGKLVEINKIVAQSEFAAHEQLDEEGKAWFRRALRESWDRTRKEPADGSR